MPASPSPYFKERNTGPPEHIVVPLLVPLVPSGRPDLCGTRGRLHGVNHHAAIAVSGEPVVGENLVLKVKS